MSFFSCFIYPSDALFNKFFNTIKSLTFTKSFLIKFEPMFNADAPAFNPT